MKKQSNKLRRETLDNFRNLLSNNAKRGDDMLAPDWAASIGERYRRKNLRVHAHMVSDLSEYCAIFEYASPIKDEVFDVSVISPRAGDERPAYPSGSHNLDKPMLIRIIDFFEQIEGIVKTATPALVWLQPLNACLMFQAKIANHATPVAVTHPLEMRDKTFFLPVCQRGRFALEKDWKLGLACGCVGFQQSQLMDQPIKSGMKIMGDFPDTDSPIEGWNGAIYADAIATVSSLRIQLRPENLIIGFNREGVTNRPETLDFTFCTPYLEARAIERMHENLTPPSEPTGGSP